MADRLEILQELDTETSSKHAKYARLAASILGAIKTGRCPPVKKLPTEQELARVTPYSLGTVQRAMRTLVASVFVVRRQGAGGFVAVPKKSRVIYGVFAFG